MSFATVTFCVASWMTEHVSQTGEERNTYKILVGNLL